MIKTFECYEEPNDTLTVEFVGNKLFLKQSNPSQEGKMETSIMLGPRETNKFINHLDRLNRKK